MFCIIKIAVAFMKKLQSIFNLCFIKTGRKISKNDKRKTFFQILFDLILKLDRNTTDIPDIDFL